MQDKTKKTREEIMIQNRKDHKKVHPQLTQKDVYNDLDYDITYEEYKIIITQFNHYLMNYLIHTGNTVALPFFLGTFFVVRGKTKGAKIDFDYYRKTGIKKIHKNKHSEGDYAKLVWNKSSKRYHNKWFKYLFTFKSNRNIRADIANAIKNHNTIYKYQSFE